MSEQAATHKVQAGPLTKLHILQINLNKSEKSHLDTINGRLSEKYDIILIQEPHVTKFNAIQTPPNFRPVFPRNRFQDNAQIRSVIWVSKHLETKHWKIIDIKDTNNITAIQLTGEYGKIIIFNIYNDCTHSRNEATLRNYILTHRNTLIDDNESHMIWAGDFNRHHPLWGDNKDTHLFTIQVLREVENIINLLADYNMEMALPKGIPMLQHMRTKKYSRPDNFFCSTMLRHYIIKCQVKAQMRPTSTNHFPIETQLDLPQSRIPPDPSFNFRTADWDKFNDELKRKLTALPQLKQIQNLQQLELIGNGLTKAIQDTI